MTNEKLKYTIRINYAPPTSIYTVSRRERKKKWNAKNIIATIGNAVSIVIIAWMPKLEKLNALVDKYVNLEYPLPNGKLVKFLDDKTIYLGNQLESEIVDGLCFGILANMDFVMICTYESDGKNHELLLYKKR